MNAEELACRIAAATQRVSLGDWGSVEFVSLRGLPEAEEIAELADAWLLPEEKERGARFVAARDQLRFRWTFSLASRCSCVFAAAKRTLYLMAAVPNSSRSRTLLYMLWKIKPIKENKIK